MLVNKSHGDSYYGKKLLWYESNFEDVSSFSNLNLAIFLACDVGTPDPSHGPIPKIIADKGGHCVMAWNKSLSNWGTTIYATQFWSNIANNKDKISDAHLKAFSALKDNPTCIEARQHDPGLDPYCNMDWLNSTENNNGCHLPLPDLSESQETHLPLTIIVPLPAPLAAQSVEAIRQFANSPEMDVSYTGANSAPYAYLYEFKSGNSHFTVNNITGRVQFAQWMEVESKDQKEVVDIDQG